MRNMNRREWLLQTACGAGALILGAPATAQPGLRPPNIVFILADDLGYGDLGCYGQKTIQTPRIDRMAREGLRFTQCYAGSTVCAPSRCALMTGLHMGHARVRGNKLVPLEPGDRTVAEILRNAGYRTGLFGKWGLGEPETAGIPNRKGFDEFFGYLNQHHAHTYYPEYLWDNDKQAPLNNKDGEHENVAVERNEYAPYLIADQAIGFIERHQRSPFFLYFTPTLPHANNERGAKLKDGMEIPDYGIYQDRDWPDPQKGHAAMIALLDAQVGRVIDTLQALGIAEETLVFFTSDNGTHKEGGGDPEFFQSSGPLRGYKRALYEGGIRAPMIAWWPGTIPGGAESDLVWSHWDFLPTAAALAHAKAPAGLDGLSVAPTLLGRPRDQQQHDYLYWEFHEGGFAQALRQGDWKAVRPGKAGSAIELYRLDEDPGETRDLAGAHPEKVAAFEALFQSARVPSALFPVAGDGSV
ncbi:MAG: arylsulfatase [Candidatus Hydrogenedentes bacterium]|nr:arylsulfatase [Candidatus Hydrogenedentota bacterium]